MRSALASWSAVPASPLRPRSLRRPPSSASPKRPDASEKPHRGRTPGTVALKYRRQSSVREEGGTLVYETVDTNPVIAKKKEKHVEVCLRQAKRRNKSDDTSPVTDFGGSMRLDTNGRG